MAKEICTSRKRKRGAVDDLIILGPPNHYLARQFKFSLVGEKPDHYQETWLKTEIPVGYLKHDANPKRLVAARFVDDRIDISVKNCEREFMSLYPTSAHEAIATKDTVWTGHTTDGFALASIDIEFSAHGEPIRDPAHLKQYVWAEIKKRGALRDVADWEKHSWIRRYMGQNKAIIEDNHLMARDPNEPAYRLVAQTDLMINAISQFSADMEKAESVYIENRPEKGHQEAFADVERMAHTAMQNTVSLVNRLFVIRIGRAAEKSWKTSNETWPQHVLGHWGLKATRIDGREGEDPRTILELISQGSTYNTSIDFSGNSPGS